MYGVLEGNIALTVGPAFRLTPTAQRLDLSIYGGIGYGRTSQYAHCFAGDLGLRFAFGSSVFNWYNFSLGCTMYGDEWIPTFGLSLSPIKGMIELAKWSADAAPQFYTETMLAYLLGDGTLLGGVSVSWVPTHLGVYGSYLAGDGLSSSCINVGPIFRLTPDHWIIDIQLYQGIGWTGFSYGSSVGGETGLRIGINSGNFIVPCLSVGINYSADDIALSFGISFLGLGALFF